MVLFMIIWLSIDRPGVFSTRFLYFVKGVRAIITFNSELDSVAKDIAKVDIILD